MHRPDAQTLEGMMFFTDDDTHLSGSESSIHSAPTKDLPPTRVLVVDADHDEATDLALLAMSGGFEVRVAYDDGEALEVIAEFHPAAVLTAVHESRVEEYVLARRLREASPEALLVAVTPLGSELDDWLVRWSGFDIQIPPDRAGQLAGLLQGFDPQA